MFWSSVKIYLLFTGFVMNVLELSQNLTVVHSFCDECFGALSKSTFCSHVLELCQNLAVFHRFSGGSF